MIPSPPVVTLRLQPRHADFLYWELLGLSETYEGTMSADDETGLRIAITQLEAGINRANTFSELQLERLRAITKRNSGLWEES